MRPLKNNKNCKVCWKMRKHCKGNGSLITTKCCRHTLSLTKADHLSGNCCYISPPTFMASLAAICHIFRKCPKRQFSRQSDDEACGGVPLPGRLGLRRPCPVRVLRGLCPVRHPAVPAPLSGRRNPGMVTIKF